MLFIEFFNGVTIKRDLSLFVLYITQVPQFSGHLKEKFLNRGTICFAFELHDY
jgi:hypothetical protein